MTTFAVVVALVTGVLSGLAPALTASRTNLVPALKTEGLDAAPRGCASAMRSSSARSRCH